MAIDDDMTCPRAEKGMVADDGMMHLLVGPPRSAATRAEGIKEIRDLMRGTEHLVVVDPYACGGEPCP